MHRRVGVPAFAALLVAGLLGSVAFGATIGAHRVFLPMVPRADNGRIAFVRFTAGVSDIVAINPDGTELVPLTDTAASERSPAWSPDRSQIAFLRDTQGGNNTFEAALFVMQADGTQARQLLPAVEGAEQLAWSPDGMRIAFSDAVAGNTDIYVVAVAGGSPVRLTISPAADVAPAWSPDGTRIACTSYRNGVAQVFVMQADGQAQTPITSSSASSFSPAWSPDGTRLALTIDHDLWTMRADGTDLRQVTAVGGDSADNASWSPDGMRLVYMRRFAHNLLLYIVNADGSGNVLLASGADPSWSAAR